MFASRVASRVRAPVRRSFCSDGQIRQRMAQKKQRPTAEDLAERTILNTTSPSPTFVFMSVLGLGLGYFMCDAYNEKWVVPRENFTKVIRELRHEEVLEAEAKESVQSFEEWRAEQVENGNSFYDWDNDAEEEVEEEEDDEEAEEEHAH